MEKYAKVVDEDLGICSVGVGTNEAYYQSIGMSLMDVELGYDGNWYLAGKAPSEPIEDLKQKALLKLESSYLSYRESKTTWALSSLGFKVNANSTAYMDVDGLVGILKTQRASGVEDATVAFMDFDNVPHDLTEEQLSTIKNEIALNGTRAYGVKWTLREQINAAQSNEDLDAIVINFDPVDPE